MKILAAAGAVADTGAAHESAQHSDRAQAGGEKITVNNFLMLSQRNKEGGRKKRVRGRGRERNS